MASAQIKNSFASIGEVDASFHPSSLVLKFCVTMGSVRYFVLSQTHHQIVFFGDYTLHNIPSPEELGKQLEKIYEKDEVLQLNFSKVLVGFDEKYSLVPQEFLAAMKADGQLSQHCGETEIVYEIHKPLLQILKKLFANAEFLHINSTYIKILPEFLEDSKEKLFVNVGRKHLDIIRFNSGKKLQLMNRYEYQSAADFIYFLILCCNELKLDRKTMELVLIGEVDIQSKIYDLCYRYFRLIRFIPKPDEVHFSKVFEACPKHLHFNLYNLSA